MSYVKAFGRVRDDVVAAALEATAPYAALAGHYANDATDTDVPGGAPGERGAKYWSGKAGEVVNGIPVGKTPSAEPAVVFQDDNNNIFLKVTEADIKHPVVDLLKTQAASGAVAGAVTRTVPSSKPRFAIEDSNGNILGDFTETEFRHPWADATKRQALTGVRASSGLVRSSQWDTIQALAEIIHIIQYGQSNSVGWGQTPLRNTIPLAWGLKFSTGVRAQDGGGTAAVNHPAFASLFETEVAGPYAETPATAMVRMIAQLLWEEDGIDITGGTLGKILVSAPGEHSKSVSDRSTGSIYFNRLKDDISYGRSLSDAVPASYQVGLTIDIGGETEYVNNVDAATYSAQLRQLRTDQMTWAQSVAGNSRPLPMLIPQVSTHLYASRTNPNIALAQLSLASTDDYIALATPTYFLPFSADNLHYIARGVDWLGAYLGLGIKRWLYDGIKPMALAPASATLIGNTIIVKFNPAKTRRLVWDTTTKTAQTNMGFQVVDTGGAALTIASTPVLVGNDRVAIRMSATPAAGAKVRYGWASVDATVAGGNLRDNRGDDIVYDRSGDALRMDNWAPIFEIGVI